MGYMGFLKHPLAKVPSAKRATSADTVTVMYRTAVGEMGVVEAETCKSYKWVKKYW